MRRALRATGLCVLLGGLVSTGCGRSPTGGASDAAGGGGTIPGAGDAAAGGSDGIYKGCSYIGGYDRAIVARFDQTTGTCVVLALMSPMRDLDASAGLTITSPWGVLSASMWSSTTADCLSSGVPPGAAKAISASGSVTVNWSPDTIDIDAILTFRPSADGPSQSVELKAQGVDLSQSC